MPNHKPFVLCSDEAAPTGEITTAQKLDVFAQPDVMVELLLSTRPRRSDQELPLAESRIEEELAWICSIENDNASLIEQCSRGLRLAYHAGYLFKNSDERASQRESLVDALVGVFTSVTPTTTLERILVTCEIPLLVLGLQVGSSQRHANWQTIIDNLSSICEENFDGEGMLASSDLCDFAEVLASMARMIQLADLVTPGTPLPKCILNQFQWAVRQQLVICMGNGRPIGGKSSRLTDEFVTLLLKLGGDPSDIRLAHHLGFLSESATGFTVELAVKAKRPKASFHSEWAQVAILR
ncbi:MAG: hypothetical protein NZ744_14435, partial [Pirellulaceae bacterium]|nr:hypothetical protein [Pirellulaceae bacterium]